MELYLIRHAQAEEPRSDLDDTRRALTDSGRERFQRAVRGLRRLGLELELLVHSPWLRALQTAEILAQDQRCELRVSAALARSPTEQLLSEIEGERVALVGHEPWLSELALWLSLGWRSYAAPGREAPLELGKGGLIHLRGTPRPGEMQLVGLYTPRELGRLGR